MKKDKIEVYINSLQATCDNCHCDNFNVEPITKEIECDGNVGNLKPLPRVVGHEYSCKRCNTILKVAETDEVDWMEV